MRSFTEIDLIAPLHRALADEQYTTPTAIQARSIPAALEGRDILGCAQTGTGKTAAFALPILDDLGRQNRRAVSRRPMALVLAPTRELAIQIGESFSTYGKRLPLRQAVIYGGVSQGPQVRALQRGAHIVAATPGRLLDLVEQGHIDLKHLEWFVIDEVDRMLDMGFLPDLKRIIRLLGKDRQSLFFSATLPPKIRELAAQLLTDPVKVNVTPNSPTVKRIEQRVLLVDQQAKQAVLRRILVQEDVERALVFARTKRRANMIAQKLKQTGISAAAIHGNKSQNARQQALADFRAKRVKVLVATDVAARGIDIDRITHVINFDLPQDPECYVHRIGRTGRAGEAGVALSLCSSGERGELRAIEALVGRRIERSVERISHEEARAATVTVTPDPPTHVRRHESGSTQPRRRSRAGTRTSASRGTSSRRRRSGGRPKTRRS